MSDRGAASDSAANRANRANRASRGVDRAAWGLAAAGAVLVWLAQPPLAWSPIAWVALVPWSLLVSREALLRRGGYLGLWLAGSLFWLVTLQGVRLAHPALYPGWIVLGIYMGAYPPLFVGLARVVHHGWRLPLWVSVPAVWTGLELIRSYAFTGFSIAMLGHSQVDVAPVMQIADIFGTYGVSFLLALTAATLTTLAHRSQTGPPTLSAAAATVASKGDTHISGGVQKGTPTQAALSPEKVTPTFPRSGAEKVTPTLPRSADPENKCGCPPLALWAASAAGRRWKCGWPHLGGRGEGGWPFLGAAVAVGLVSVTLGYGYWRLAAADALAEQPPLIAALLIQRNEPLVYSMDPEREAAVFNSYLESALAAIREYPEADVVVWPESMFTGGLPLRVLGEPWVVPEEVGMSRPQFKEVIEDQQAMFLRRATDIQRMAAMAASRSQPPELLVGSSIHRYGTTPQAFGGAVHLNTQHEIAAWYGKMHLVMFGEYIPFGGWLPWLYEIGPLRQGATPGDGPITMEIAGAAVAPSICFETMVEQVTGNSLRRLASEGENPQLIINLTNDAWFHGSSILDHHRRCSQAIAVANRRPLLMAANQGPTVWIDGSGRQIASLPHEVNRPLLARPTADGRWSVYRSVGDKLVWPLAILCGAAAISGWRNRRR